MKAVRFLPLIILTFSIARAQTIRRVNNNAGVTGVNVYSSAQDAHDAAAANDILLIEPSETYYGTLVVSKPVKIYGNGYFLDQNTDLRADDRHSSVQVQFYNGSGGSKVSGIRGSIDIYGASDITIERCEGSIYIITQNSSGTTDYNISNIRVKNNFISPNIELRTNPGYTATDVQITNNIIYCASSFTALLAVHSGINNLLVRNNLFSRYQNHEYGISVINGIFENNLVEGCNGINFDNVSYSYNISSGDHFPSGVGNQNNVDFSNEFVGTGSDDEKFVIKPTSYLKTAASDGGEIGPFGGSSPYVISGIPPIPSVSDMFNSATGSNDVPLQVTISVKSNN